jgi:hypothetical protein
MSGQQANVARIERSESGVGIVAARSFPDFAPLNPGYAFERTYKNRILANLCSGDRFLVAVALFVDGVALQCLTATKPTLQRLTMSHVARLSDRI